MHEKERLQQLEIDVSVLAHNLDEALTMIAQVQQAVLENDERTSDCHKAMSKLTDSLLTFWKNYELPHVK